MNIQHMSIRNVEQLLPFAKDAEAMLGAKFKVPVAEARELVVRVLVHFWRKKRADFKNPRRALLHTCHGWAVKGGLRA